MKILIFLPAFILSFLLNAYAQCDTVPVANPLPNVVYAHHHDPLFSDASNCVDGDPQTHWHTPNQNGEDFPHEVWLDMGIFYNITGFRYLPRQAGSTNGKMGSYEIYVANDSANWGNPDKAGTFTYSGSNDIVWKYAHFGSIFGRYVRIVALNQWPSGNFLVASEFEVLMNTCNASIKENQVISLTEISKKTTTDPPITLDGVSTSGLTVGYGISGPATISGNQLILDGTAGTVTLFAYQNGDADYYPADTVFRIFEVIDLNSYVPQVTTTLSGDFPIEMPSLSAYPIYANATIDEPDFLWITDLSFDVSNGTIDTVFRDGENLGMYWTPASYGTHDVSIIATGNNGRDTTLTISVEVVAQANDQTVQTFDRDLIAVWTTGQTIYRSYDLPQFVGAYDSIHAYLSITCPPGGCDPYDRGAWIEVKDASGNWIQIIRYITPFGIGCDHSIDVTDYAALLQGRVEMRMYISTWSDGWETSLNLSYFAGQPEYKYTRVTEIWDGNFPFGNPANLQPVDTVTHLFFPTMVDAKLVISNTGHGWGNNNTGNAAEFFRAAHKIIIDDSVITQDLWRDCNPNPDNCTGQMGTWQFDRAGWCPGAISPPDVFPLSSFIAHDSIVLSYVFQENYMDQCHAQNPNCVSGVTCADCNDGFNPQYDVDGQIISYSNNPFVPDQEPYLGIKNLRDKEFEVSLFPNPTSGAFYIKTTEVLQGKTTVLVQDVSGRLLKNYLFNSSKELNAYEFSSKGLISGIYFVSIFNGSEQAFQKLLVK